MDMENLIGETTEYDKKAALEVKKPKSWCKSVSAFANTLGGALIFGMADDGQIVGLTEPDSDAEKISEIIQPTLAGLKIDPCIPHEMDGFTLRRVWRGATYEIVVENPDHLEKGVKAMTVDGKPVSGNILSPVPAGSTVEVKIVMG